MSAPRLHLRGETAESLAGAFPELPFPVARRVLHRVVGEDRDDLEGVRGLSKRAARAATSICWRACSISGPSADQVQPRSVLRSPSRAPPNDNETLRVAAVAMS